MNNGGNLGGQEFCDTNIERRTGYVGFGNLHRHQVLSGRGGLVSDSKGSIFIVDYLKIGRGSLGTLYVHFYAADWWLNRTAIHYKFVVSEGFAQLVTSTMYRHLKKIRVNFFN